MGGNHEWGEYADGKKTVQVYKTGDLSWTEKEKAHTTENSGRSTVKLLKVEVYGQPTQGNLVAPAPKAVVPGGSKSFIGGSTVLIDREAV